MIKQSHPKTFPVSLPKLPYKSGLDLCTWYLQGQFQRQSFVVCDFTKNLALHIVHIGQSQVKKAVFPGRFSHQLSQSNPVAEVPHGLALCTVASRMAKPPDMMHVEVANQDGTQHLNAKTLPFLLAGFD